jgi:hypothetical protein
MGLGLTQTLTKMSARNFSWGKALPAHRSDNIGAICELIVYKILLSGRFTTLWDSMTCYKETFTILLTPKYLRKCYCFCHHVLLVTYVILYYVCAFVQWAALSIDYSGPLKNSIKY